MNRQLTAILFLTLMAWMPSASAQDSQQLPDTDEKPADMSKPLQVYILLGQSNMLGAGKIDPGKKDPEGSLMHAVKEKGFGVRR